MAQKVTLDTAACGLELPIFSIFSRDSEVTLGTFAVHLGRRFGTKLGGVLVQKRRVSGRQGGGRKQAEKNENVEVDQVCWVSVVDASESNVRHATRVVAAAAGAEERVFFSFFLEIQKGR